MRIVPYAEVSRPEWNLVCDRSDEAWLFHRYDWVAIESRYSARGNYSFAVARGDGTLAGVTPIYLYELGLGSFTERLLASGLRPAGPAAIPELNPADLKALRSATMREIERLAELLSCDRIQLGAQNLAPKYLGAWREEIPFWVLDHGFELGIQFGSLGMTPAPGMATCAVDQVIDLTHDEETILARLDGSCRRALRKAKSDGVQFDHENLERSEATVGRFYALAQLSATRTGETLLPIEYYADLLAAFATDGRVVMLFARKDGSDAAALMLGIDKEAASFLGGVSDPYHLSSRVNDFIHWSAIRWARERGCAWYRLGPVFPSLPADWPVSRFSRFKSKFGARPLITIHGSRFLRPERYFELGVEALKVRCGKTDRQIPSDEEQEQRASKASEQARRGLFSTLRRDGSRHER